MRKKPFFLDEVPTCSVFDSFRNGQQFKSFCTTRLNACCVRAYQIQTNKLGSRAGEYLLHSLQVYLRGRRKSYPRPFITKPLLLTLVLFVLDNTHDTPLHLAAFVLCALAIFLVRRPFARQVRGARAASHQCCVGAEF